MVVPVRNGEASIGETLRALLGQDHPDDLHEVIVVDNGSTDGTAAVIRAQPVSYIHEPTPGVSHARNRGIAESRGEVIAFLDGDCVPVPLWLSEIAEPFGDPKVGCVAGELGHGPVHTVAERQAVRMLGEWQRHAVSSKPPYAVTANAAYRREVLDAIGHFDPDLSRAQDVELGLRFHDRSALKLVFAEKALAHHRHRSSQLGFLRQQFGWAYGAGLVAAKRQSEGGESSPRPKLRYVGRNIQGLGLVGIARLRGRAQPEWLEDAWFNLLHQVSWYAGGNLGMSRGARIWRTSS